MEQTITLSNNEYNDIVSKNMTRIYTLYNGRKRAIQGGDYAYIENKDTKEKTKVKIIKMSIYATFYDMYNEYFNMDFKNKFQNIEELMYNNPYTAEEEEMYACVVFEIDLV